MYRGVVKRSQTNAHRLGLLARKGALAVLGGVAVVAGSALPWVATGTVERSAFTLARVANELAIFERRSQRVAVYALLSTPVLVPLGLVFLAVEWRRFAAASLAVCGLIGLISGALGGWGSNGSTIGPMVTGTGGALALVGSFFLGRAAAPETQRGRND